MKALADSASDPSATAGASPAKLGLIWRPEVFLCLVAFFTAVLIHPGTVGIDTERRLQATHSLWTDAPPVVDGPEGWPDFGIKGVNGTVHAWYGIGQSLVMLPADIVATAGLSFTDIKGEAYFKLKSVIVGYLVFPLISMLAVLACFKLLTLLGFSRRESLCGALGLLFCSTFLQYTQKNTENSLLLLLLLCGFYFITRWLEEGSLRFLIAGALLPGFNLLMRLPNVVDLAVVFLYAGIVILVRVRNSEIDRRRALVLLRNMLLVFGCVFLFFIFWDRFYQWRRFGSVFTSYFHLHGEEYKALYPELSRSYPFSTPFFTGFLGALFSPARSVFLFDPLLIITILTFAKLRRRIGMRPKVLAVSLAVLAFALIVFYATFYNWGGSHAWGGRFVVVPIELIAMLGLALIARHFKDLKRSEKALACVLVAVSSIIQLASTVFSCSLEEWQIATLGFSFVIGLRFANLAGVLFGKAADWGLSDFPTWEGFSRPFYLPFRFAAYYPGRIGGVLLLLWLTGIALLLAYVAMFLFKHKRAFLRMGD